MPHVDLEQAPRTLALRVRHGALFLALCLTLGCGIRSTNVRTIPDSGGRTWTGTAHVMDHGRPHDAVGFAGPEVVKAVVPSVAFAIQSEGQPLYPTPYAIHSMAQETTAGGVRRTWLHAEPEAGPHRLELFYSDADYQTHRRRPLAPGTAIIIDDTTNRFTKLCDMAGVQEQRGEAPYVTLTACAEGVPLRCALVLAQVQFVDAGWRPAPERTVRVVPEGSFLIDSCMNIATTGTSTSLTSQYLALGFDAGSVMLYRAGDLARPALTATLPMPSGHTMDDLVLLRSRENVLYLAVFWRRQYDDGEGRVRIYRIDRSTDGTLTLRPEVVIEETTPAGTRFMETPGNISPTSKRELHFFSPAGIVVHEYDLND